jgi:hypothetical protein
VRVLVVYESMFGNTLAVAEAIAAGLRGRLEVELVEVASAPVVLGRETSLLVVGGPTHGHAMTTPGSRADAAKRAGERLVSRGAGIREWTAAVRLDTGGPSFATFDTRIKGPELLWGSAAKGAARALRASGFLSLRAPESFLIDGPTGPVFDRVSPAELARARAWGEELARAVESRLLAAAPA